MDKEFWTKTCGDEYLGRYLAIQICACIKNEDMKASETNL